MSIFSLGWFLYNFSWIILLPFVEVHKPMHKTCDTHLSTIALVDFNILFSRVLELHLPFEPGVSPLWTSFACTPLFGPFSSPISFFWHTKPSCLSNFLELEWGKREHNAHLPIDDKMFEPGRTNFLGWRKVWCAAFEIQKYSAVGSPFAIKIWYKKSLEQKGPGSMCPARSPW